MQRVGDVLIGRNHRALILSRNLFQRSLRGALSVQQRAAFEYRLADAAGNRPERAAPAEQPGDLVRGTAERPGDRELRQHGGHRGADLRVGGVTTHTVLHNLVFGCLLVFLVQWIFLGNLRSAIIVGANIPFALLFSVTILYLMGESA